MDLVDPTRVEEDPLRQRRLTGVNVRRDPDVAQLLHRLLPPWLLIVRRSRLRARRIPRRELPEVEGAADEGRRWRRRGRGGGGVAERVEEAWRGGLGEACHGGFQGFRRCWGV